MSVKSQSNSFFQFEIHSVLGMLSQTIRELIRKGDRGSAFGVTDEILSGHSEPS